MKDKDLSFCTWEEAVLWLRQQPDQSKLVYDSYYDDPLIDAAERYYQSDEWKCIARNFLSEKGQVLDIGAGRGIASYALAKEGFNVTSLEPDSSSVVGAGAIRSLAEESEFAIHVVEDTSEQLPFPDDYFHVVFARAVLHHTSDLAMACREMARVLQPGGLLIAVREHVISSKDDLPKFLESHQLHSLYGGENAFLLEQYSDALCSAGLEIERHIKPLDSPINYFPQTKESIRKEIASRARAIPGGAALLSTLLSIPLLFSLAIKLIGIIDQRPGRLYSFIYTKPL